MSGLSRATTVRVYRLSAGKQVTVPQGGRVLDYDHDKLRFKMSQVFIAEVAKLQVKAVGEARVSQASVGPDSSVATLWHPTLGVLKTVIVSVE